MLPFVPLDFSSLRRIPFRNFPSGRDLFNALLRQSLLPGARATGPVYNSTVLSVSDTHHYPEHSLDSVAHTPLLHLPGATVPLKPRPKMSSSSSATSFYPVGTPYFEPASPCFEDRVHPASLSVCGIHDPALLELIRTDVSREMVCE